MAATKKQRIIYTTISTMLIIIISAIYRYEPNVVEERIKKDWNKPERQFIKLVNKDSGWIELKCKAYYDRNFSTPFWSSNASILIPPGQQGIITLPKISEIDIISLFCKYRGWNGCQAELLNLFESPGNDPYYCSESQQKCSFVFQPDGSVNQMYGKHEYSFLGYIPTVENQEKCSWIDCLLDPETRIIGKKSCCGPKCTLW